MEKREAVAVLMESPVYSQIDLPGRAALVDEFVASMKEEENKLRQNLDALKEAL